MIPIVPFVELPKVCLSKHASQGLVYALDSQIVIKVPFQYRPTDCLEETHYLDLVLCSFFAFENEIKIYQYLEHHTHANIARRLGVERSDCLFLERLTPLESAWPDSTDWQRSKWAVELLNGLSWLEQHGWCTGDLAVRNIGIDDNGHLKIFDFGSAVSHSFEYYAEDVTREHFKLASCLLFLFSGVDPIDEAKSFADAKRVKKNMEDGLFRIPDEAARVAHIILRGWRGHNSEVTFQQILLELKEIFPEVETEIKPKDESYYIPLEARCQEWLRSHESNPNWMNVDEYVAACHAAGANVDLDAWRCD